MLTVKQRPHYVTRTAAGGFAFQLWIPSDLRPVRGAASVRRVLPTADKREAHAMARTIARGCHALFDEVRAGSPTLETVAVVPGRVRALVDEAIDTQRAGAAFVVTGTDSCSHVLLFNTAPVAPDLLARARHRADALLTGPARPYHGRRWA